MIAVAWQTVEPHFIGRRRVGYGAAGEDVPIFRDRTFTNVARWSDDDTPAEIERAKLWIVSRDAPSGCVVVCGADTDACMLEAEHVFRQRERAQ